MSASTRTSRRSKIDFPHVISHERVEPGPQLARERVPCRLVAVGAGAYPPLRAAARLACHPGWQTSAPRLAGRHVAAEVVDIESHVLAIRARRRPAPTGPRPAGTATRKKASSAACSLARLASARYFSRQQQVRASTRRPWDLYRGPRAP